MFFLTILSAIAAVLTLVGYGVSLSVEQFNLPHETLFASPFEVLELSQWAVLRFLNKMSAAQIWEFYRHAVVSTLPAILVATLILMVVVLFVKGDRKFRAAKNRLTSIGVYFFKVDKFDSAVASIRKLIAYMTVMGVLLPVVYLLLFLAFVAAGTFLITLPALGLFAGEAHISDDVIKPATCYPLKSREYSLVENVKKIPHAVTYAACVQLSTDRGSLHRGRVAFATSSAVILYDPATGTVKRVPTKDATIEVIDRL